ncbi:hypothetical protein LBYZC6_46850 [Lacrimispora brassicae]
MSLLKNMLGNAVPKAQEGEMSGRETADCNRSKIDGKGSVEVFHVSFLSGDAGAF